MPKLSLGKLVGGFKNPKTRPRFIIWTGSVVFFLAGFVLFAMMVTSTNWFCAEVCHGVQVDSVAAWEMSTHAKVPCVTCHMPVNADPITHVIKKAGSLLKLYKTAAGQFQQPLNADQSVALNDFPDELCTQCHTDNRNFTPSPGIIIDHAVHTENEVRCAHCHNRVGHIQDDIVLAAEDPNTGEIGWRLDDWMEKPGCFRCHGQEEDAAATGECAACHTPDFELVPADHNVDNFVSEVHADMAMEEYARVEAARVRAEEMKPEVAPGVEAYTPAEPDHPWTDIPPANQINYCYTCHAQSFCSDCHGMEMPHTPEFERQTHGAVSDELAVYCNYCHQPTPDNDLFCNTCHHGVESNWEYQPAVAWEGVQHAQAVATGGVQVCLNACHDMQFCLDCHNRVDPLPASHQTADFLRKPAAQIGTHAEMYNAQPEACAVCHGPGMINDNEFCVDCHVLDVPHPQEFRQFHVTGEAQQRVCANCHTFRELCSDCHHPGAIDGRPWTNEVHGPAVARDGSVGCLEACHTEQFCIDCHLEYDVPSIR